MADSTISALPESTSPSPGDVVPVDVYVNGSTTTSSVTLENLVLASGAAGSKTLAGLSDVSLAGAVAGDVLSYNGTEFVASAPASGGSGGSGSSTGVLLVNDFNNSATPSFTPTIGQKYTFVCEYTLTTASQTMRAQLQTPSNQSFEVAILNNALAAANYTGSSVDETTYNVGGSAGLGKRTITVEFCVYAGNVIDFRGFCDGFYAGGFYQVPLTDLSGEPLTPYYYTDSPTPTSAKLYQGWLVTEIADAITTVGGSSGGGSSSTASEIVPLTFANALGTVSAPAADGSYTFANNTSSTNLDFVADQTFDLTLGKFLELDLVWSYPNFTPNNSQVIGMEAWGLGTAAVPAPGNMPASQVGGQLTNYDTGSGDTQFRINGNQHNRVVDSVSAANVQNSVPPPFYRTKLRIIPMSSGYTLYECTSGDGRFNWYTTEDMLTTIYVSFGSLPNDGTVYTVHRFTARLASLTTDAIS